MIKSKIHTKVKNQKYVDELLKKIGHRVNSYVSIGIHQDAGTYEDAGDIKGYGEPVSVVEVALWQEFGTESIPSRSFIRTTMDDNSSKINAWRTEMIENILFKGWTVEKALEAIGLRIQILIQNKIKSNVPPPLAESTANAKLAKGRPAVTLIDSGLMLRSVTYKVHLK